MKFIAKYRELRIVMVPTYKQMMGLTQQLVVGKSIQFENYEYETEDKEEIAFLRANINYKRGIIGEEMSSEERENTILEMAEKIKSKRVGGEVKAETGRAIAEGSSVADFACDQCDTVAKSNAGLSAHKRKMHA
jgi:hypothetical protein